MYTDRLGENFSPERRDSVSGNKWIALVAKNVRRAAESSSRCQVATERSILH